MQSSHISADSETNILTVTLTGKVTNSELDFVHDNLKDSISQLNPGFSLISDYTQCQVIYLSGLHSFYKIVNHMVESGANEIIRVVQSGKIIHKQIVNLTKRIQCYQPRYVPTIRDAHKILSESKKRDGLRIHLHDMAVSGTHETMNWSGTLTNLSTSGCSIRSTTFFPGTKEKVTLYFNLRNTNNLPQDFAIPATVIWQNSTSFSVKFLPLPSATHRTLATCIASETGRLPEL